MKKLIGLVALCALMAGCRGGSGRVVSETVGPADTVAVGDVPQAEDDVSGLADKADAEAITFAFAGDMMLGTTYPRERLTADDAASLLLHVAPILQSADVAAANLEGALLDGDGVPKECRDTTQCYTFRMPQCYAGRLADAGIDFVSIANNHAGDFGVPGLRSTRHTLDSVGIAFAGLRGVAETAVIERRGLRIGFTAFDHAAGTLDVNSIAELRRVVTKLDSVCDIVVVSFHGGAEGRGHTHVADTTEMFLGYRRGNVRAFAHAAVDAGADIVYGHGPHVPRGLEVYRDRLVIYSLGNFATPYGFSLTGISGLAPLVTVSTDRAGRFNGGHIHSFRQASGTGPLPDPSGAASALMRTLSREDFPQSPLIIAEDGELSVVQPNI